MSQYKTSPVFKQKKSTTSEEDYESVFDYHKTLLIDFPSLETSLKQSQSGHQYDNWEFVTIWNQDLLEDTHPWLRMVPGEVYSVVLEQFENLVREGYRGMTREDFKLAQNPIIVKILKSVEEPYRPISEAFCVPVMEYCFEEQANEVTVNSTPLYLIACSGLADILRAVYKETDLLIIRGGYSRIAISEGSGYEKTYLLTNLCSSPRETVQIIRLTFMDDARTELIESITPQPKQGRFRFKYYAAATIMESDYSCKRRSRVAIWHQDFKWVNLPGYDIFDKRSITNAGSLAEFQAPIPQHVDAYIPYLRLMTKVPTNASTSRSVRTYTYTRTSSRDEDNYQDTEEEEEEEIGRQPSRPPPPPAGAAASSGHQATPPRNEKRLRGYRYLMLKKLLKYTFLLLSVLSIFGGLSYILQFFLGYGITGLFHKLDQYTYCWNKQEEPDNSIASYFYQSATVSNSDTDAYYTTRSTNETGSVPEMMATTLGGLYISVKYFLSRCLGFGDN